MKPFIGSKVVVILPTRRTRTITTWKPLLTEDSILKAIVREGSKYNLLTHTARRHFFLKTPRGGVWTTEYKRIQFVRNYKDELMIAPSVSFARLERQLTRGRRFRRWLARV